MFCSKWTRDRQKIVHYMRHCVRSTKNLFCGDNCTLATQMLSITMPPEIHWCSDQIFEVIFLQTHINRLDMFCILVKTISKVTSTIFFFIPDSFHLDARAKTMWERLNSDKNNSNFEIATLFRHLCSEGKSAANSNSELFWTEWSSSYIVFTL